MKLLGMAFIVCASGSVGFRVSHSLKERCRLLLRFQELLRRMEHEIVFYGTPLPQLFALLAASETGILERLCADTAREMERCRWTTPRRAMEKALQSAPEPILGPILLGLCEQLGKYDREAMSAGIAAAQEQTGAELRRLEQERSVKSGTYQTLGICAGLAACVLLL